MNSQKFKYLLNGWMISIFISLGATTSVQAQPNPSYETEVHALTQMMKNTLEEYGIGEVKERFYQAASSGFDLFQYKDQILAANQGHALQVPVAVHTTTLAYVSYANKQLDHMGIDFIRYQAIEDPSLPPLNAPLPSETKQAVYWKIARSIITPSMGFLATLLMDHQLEATANLTQSLFSGATLQSLDISPQLQKDLIIGATIWVLEQQFNWFTNSWARLWQDNRPLNIQIKLGQFAQLPPNHHFQQTVNKLTSTLNQIAAGLNSAANYKKDQTHGMSLNEFLGQLTYSHLWSYLVNWGYAASMYSIGVYASHQLGLTQDSWSALDLLMKSGVMTTAFYLAFGLDQVILAQLTSRGEITPLLRQKAESTAGFWNNFWRVTSAIPGLYSLGIGMQLAWGVVITAPLYWKLDQLEKLGFKIQTLFEKNQLEKSPVPFSHPFTACEIVFEEPGAILYRGQTMMGIAKKIFKK